MNTIIQDLREYQSRVSGHLPFEHATWALERSRAIQVAVAKLQEEAGEAEKLRALLAACQANSRPLQPAKPAVATRWHWANSSESQHWRYGEPPLWRADAGELVIQRLCVCDV